MIVIAITPQGAPLETGELLLSALPSVFLSCGILPSLLGSSAVTIVAALSD